jgi:hypothetical protein
MIPIKINVRPRYPGTMIPLHTYMDYSLDYSYAMHVLTQPPVHVHDVQDPLDSQCSLNQQQTLAPS